MRKEKEPLTIVHVSNDACVCKVSSPDLCIVLNQAPVDSQDHHTL